MSRIGDVFARLAAALAMFVALQSAALADYQLNDRVQAWVSGVWYDGTVVGFGSGDYAGEYYVQFDQGGRSYYVNANNVRPLGDSATPVGPAVPSARFTPGLYVCLYADQYFDLSLGGDLTYRQTKPELEGGDYELDTATGLIRFTTGPYSIGQWTAEVHNAADRAGVLLHADKDYECRAAR